VHAFTFRNENAFLPADLRRGDRDADLGDGIAECAAFLRAGVDGVFADDPGTAVIARDLVAAASGQTIRLSS
jgi:glycerophosphoryl diester phosphodiesterase